MGQTRTHSQSPHIGENVSQSARLLDTIARRSSFSAAVPINFGDQSQKKPFVIFFGVDPHILAARELT